MDSWRITNIKNRFVCFVEPDCLVSEDYFQKQIAEFKSLSPRVIILGSSTAIKHWDNKIYGYSVTPGEMTIPNRKPKTQYPYPVQMGYIPGAIMRVSSLKRITLPLGSEEDLLFYSSKISLNIWGSGITYDDKHPEGQLGTQVYINPNVTYCTTEDYVNDIGKFEEHIKDNLIKLFIKESI